MKHETSHNQIKHNRLAATRAGQATADEVPLLSEKQREFFASIRFTGIAELAASLERIHDLALYHTTDHPIELSDKEALLDVKTLWQALVKLEEL